MSNEKYQKCIFSAFTESKIGFRSEEQQHNTNVEKNDQKL